MSWTPLGSSEKVSFKAHDNALPFTLAEYRILLERTKALYEFRSFESIGHAVEADESFCLMRHDVDMSPLAALEIAKIEAELEVRSTYTILLTGKFYSPFERKTRDILRQIAHLGHHIGLHFDASWHDIKTEEALEGAVAWEASVLSGLCEAPVRMFSFHNTTPFSMACKAQRYSGMSNAYAGILQQNVSYLSDSNGHWRFRSWSDGLNDHPARLQILTHPEWWSQLYNQPAEKVCALIEERARLSWTGYCELLERGGRENRSAVPRALKFLRGHPLGEKHLRHWLAGNREEAVAMLLNQLELSDSGKDDVRIKEIASIARRIRSRRNVPDSDLIAAFEDLADRFARYNK